MIVPMNCLILAGRESNRTQILEVLRKSGVAHIDTVAKDGSGIPGDLLREIDRTSKALTVIETLAPSQTTIAPPGTPSRLVKEITETYETLKKSETEISVLKSELDQIKPWGNLGLRDLAVLKASGLHLGLFTVSEEIDVDFPNALCKTVNISGGKKYVFAVSREPFPDQESVTACRIPSRDIAELNGRIAALNSERQQYQESLCRLAKRREEINDYLSELLERKRFNEIESGLSSDGPVFFLQGWVPVDSSGILKETFESASIPVAIVLEKPDPEDSPPTKLENASWCRPIELLYGFMGVVPGYRESDIAPVFFPAMVLFAGMLVADAGYGALAFITVLAMQKYLVSKKVPVEFVRLLLAFFAGITIYGMATNTYFGTAFLKLSPVDNSTAAGKLLLQKLCFIIGAVHLTIAHCWRTRNKNVDLALLAEIGWIMFIWAMYALVCVLVLSEPAPKYMVPMFAVSTFLILFFTAPSWNIFSALMAGLGEFAINASGFLSDIISYIRLWAVGLAGGVLAESFNQLAAPMPLLLAVLILIVGHSINFALGMIAVLAHGVRLNLLEFSNHLGMEWSGREYDPFRRRKG